MTGTSVAVVVDLVSIVLLMAAAYVKGRRDGRARESRSHVDISHVERVHRQMRSDVLRSYDQHVQTVTIVSANGDRHHLTPKDPT